MKTCGALGPDEDISGAVEAVSFDHTLREIERLVEENLNKDRVVLVKSVEIYEVMRDF